MNWRKAKLLREHLIMSTGNEPERDPEIIAKRVAEMQQMTNPPSTRNLTIIWETEKAELHQRIEALEADVKYLKSSLRLLLTAQERYLGAQTERGVSGTIPLSEHPLYKEGVKGNVGPS